MIATEIVLFISPLPILLFHLFTFLHFFLYFQILEDFLYSIIGFLFLDQSLFIYG